MNKIDNKLNELGGVKLLEETDSLEIDSTLNYIKNTMGILPEKEVINFSVKYGFSIFKNQIFIESIENSAFINDKVIKLEYIYGFGNKNYNIKKIIQTYYIQEQLNQRFYPLFAGYPGDIIYYSLEKNTFGEIFYWHHEANIDEDKILISKTFGSFIDDLYFIKKEPEQLNILTDEELTKINNNRKKVGLPTIDKFRNPIE